MTINYSDDDLLNAVEIGKKLTCWVCEGTGVDPSSEKLRKELGLDLNCFNCDGEGVYTPCKYCGDPWRGKDEFHHCDGNPLYVLKLKRKIKELENFRASLGSLVGI